MYVVSFQKMKRFLETGQVCPGLSLGFLTLTWSNKSKTQVVTCSGRVENG